MTIKNSVLDRRRFLRGTGVALGLPLLESFMPKTARAAGPAPGYAVFLVDMNGVQQQPGFGNEPERFWPTKAGALTTASMMADSGRAVSELAAYADYLNIIRGVSMAFDGNGCGHSGGGNQLLTAAKVSADPAKNKSLAMGPSADYRISQALAGKEPFALYAGPKYGYINDHISFRGTKDLIIAEANPWTAYSKIVSMTGGAGAAQELVLNRRRSVNDLVRGELNVLLGDKTLSSADRQRISMHLASVRDIEQQMVKELPAATVADLKSVDGQQGTDGNRLKVLALEFDLAVFALASGQHRVVFIQNGDGTDGIGYTVNGVKLPSYHHISHRINGDGTEGTPIDGADLMHHQIDRIHLRHFGMLIGKMGAVKTPMGSLLDLGFAAWANQLGDGYHQYKNVPYIIAGRAGGYLKTGQFLDLPKVMNNKLLNTLITAAGVRSSAGGPIDDFGDPSLPKGLIPGLVA
ncbi:MAG: DUF1552 domain-containing protein [Deltaproteobacteria bacterium]|nr:DUF1552 domain-containing protein [Deltaproteobacteria bacterium]